MDGPPPPELNISPPLLNSANPWATTLDHLRALYECPDTGAVTTRTTLIQGFAHDGAVHQYTFFDPVSGIPNESTSATTHTPGSAETASLNNLGYSPLPLEEYLGFIKTIASDHVAGDGKTRKPIIVSVTGSPEDIAQCYVYIAALQAEISIPLAMEINLSCPNIPNHPPPAYSSDALSTYLSQLPLTPSLPIGLKTPPYTYTTQFSSFISALRDSSTVTTRTSLTKTPCRISFLTATNTLGSCLVLAADGSAQLPGSGIGGMAGPPLHALALGNVATLRTMLDENPELRHVRIIGVGGVSDAGGFGRMRKVGAYAVGVGTALGREGVEVFGKISEELGGKW